MSNGIKGMKCISKLRSPKFQYKIRQLTSGNITGEAFGITVPLFVVKQFTNITLQLIVTGSGFSYFIKEKDDKNGKIVNK